MGAECPPASLRAFAAIALPENRAAPSPPMPCSSSAVASCLPNRAVANFLFTLKGHQRTPLSDICLLSDEDMARGCGTSRTRVQNPSTAARSGDSIWISGELKDYRFLGVGQVFAVRRETVKVESGRRRNETAYGIISLTVGTASPQRLLALDRGTGDRGDQPHPRLGFDEDRIRIRVGHNQQNSRAPPVIEVTAVTKATRICSSSRSEEIGKSVELPAGPV